MHLKVAKFGGSSLADAECFRNAARIIKADPSRKYIVVSAPGKRGDPDTKITDLLLDSLTADGGDASIDEVAERFLGIIEQLQLRLSIEDDIALLRKAAHQGMRDYVVSRGEYISARIMAALLGYDFVDAKDVVCFEKPYVCDWAATRKKMKNVLKMHSCAVIPGFYGADADGNICTFLRGGSDVTGAIAADAAQADFYENWTDVSGVFAADPKIVPNARTIPNMTYDELRIFSHFGANVLHEDAVLPCKRSGIPILVKNSGRPWDEGTVVVPAFGHGGTFRAVGISRKDDMAVLRLKSAKCGGRSARDMQSLLQSVGLSAEYLLQEERLVVAAVDGRSMRRCEAELRSVCIHLDVEIAYGCTQIGVLGRGTKGSDAMLSDATAALKRSNIFPEMLLPYREQACAAVIVHSADSTKAMSCLYSRLIHQNKLPESRFAGQRVHTAVI